MPDIYDEFGRKVEKPKKRKWTGSEPDYPMTFALSVVNRETGEGLKDFGSEPKLKTPKGAMKSASKNILMGWYNNAVSERVPVEFKNLVGLWLERQNWNDLDFVARPVETRKDVDRHQIEEGEPREDYSFWNKMMFQADSLSDAMDYVSSPPTMPQRYREAVIDERATSWATMYASGEPHGAWEYHQGSYHGLSFVIPFLDIVEM